MLVYVVSIAYYGWTISTVLCCIKKSHSSPHTWQYPITRTDSRCSTAFASYYKYKKIWIEICGWLDIRGTKTTLRPLVLIMYVHDSIGIWILPQVITYSSKLQLLALRRIINQLIWVFKYFSVFRILVFFSFIYQQLLTGGYSRMVKQTSIVALVRYLLP